MKKIYIATKNRVKISAIKRAFESFFGEEISIQGFEAASGVPDQPIREEVTQGARNRLENLKAETASSPDFFASCEGGLIEISGNWYNVQVVLVEERTGGRRGSGISPGYPIPKKLIGRILENSLAEVLDETFDGKGGIRALTNNLYTREDLVYQGTLMALSGLKWPE